MKEKIKNVISIIFVVAIIILAVLSYPWSVSVNGQGKTVCSNLFGKVTRCR